MSGSMGPLGHGRRQKLTGAKGQWRRGPSIFFTLLFLGFWNSIVSATLLARRHSTPLESSLAEVEKRGGRSAARGLASAVRHRLAEGEGRELDALDRLVEGALADLQSDRALLQVSLDAARRVKEEAIHDGAGSVPLSQSLGVTRESGFRTRLARGRRISTTAGGTAKRALPLSPPHGMLLQDCHVLVRHTQSFCPCVPVALELLSSTFFARA